YTAPEAGHDGLTPGEDEYLHWITHCESGDGSINDPLAYWHEKRFNPTWGACCSGDGICGQSSKYCGEGCQPSAGNCNAAAPLSETTPGPGGVSPDGSCGGTNKFICGGSPFGDCCSEQGLCGNSTVHCDNNCLPDFGTCGPSNCCSGSGWCGKENDHCGAGCQNGFGTCTGGDSGNVSTDGSCGKNGKPCKGSDFGDYCSEQGYCGKTDEFCVAGCQSNFGTCAAETDISTDGFCGKNGKVCKGSTFGNAVLPRATAVRSQDIVMQDVRVLLAPATTLLATYPQMASVARMERLARVAHSVAAALLKAGAEKRRTIGARVVSLASALAMPQLAMSLQMEGAARMARFARAASGVIAALRTATVAKMMVTAVIDVRQPMVSTKAFPLMLSVVQETARLVLALVLETAVLQMGSVEVLRCTAVKAVKLDLLALLARPMASAVALQGTAERAHIMALDVNVGSGAAIGCSAVLSLTRDGIFAQVIVDALNVED
ncbi:hypothetical protein FANTH_12860, partial [Fusarium anthophilum]